MRQGRQNVLRPKGMLRDIAYCVFRKSWERFITATLMANQAGLIADAKRIRSHATLCAFSKAALRAFCYFGAPEFIRLFVGYSLTEC